MVDSSWDNGGGAPKKPGLGTGTKVLLGCGVALLLGVVTCTVGGMALGHMIKKDPEAFEKRMEGWAKGMMQKDWEHLRALVDQVQTEDGARALYRSNPDLRQGYPTEEGFLTAARGWRTLMTPLPVEIPMEESRHGHRGRKAREASPEGRVKTHSVSLNKMFGNTTIVCRYPDGLRLSVTFHGDKVGSIAVE